jgi:hypothetical protein
VVDEGDFVADEGAIGEKLGRNVDGGILEHDGPLFRVIDALASVGSVIVSPTM